MGMETPMAGWGFGRERALQRSFEQAHRAGGQALQEGRLPQAESYFDEAVQATQELVGLRMNDLEVRRWVATSLANQAEVLRRMGANPETEEPLVQASTWFRSIAEATPDSAEAKIPLAMTLLQLAKTYRGQEHYIDFTRSPMLTVDAMRAYRLEKLQAGAWGGSMAGSYSPEWRERGEDPLLEAIPLFGELSMLDAGQFAPLYALALNLLGDLYVNSERAREAVAPLQEAESVYQQLVARGDSRHLELLADTRSLLSQAQAGAGMPADRVGALEELIPHLRAQAHVSAEEWRTGVTMSKANARDAYRQALEELADLYTAQGREAESRAIWDGDLGVMMVESLPIRRG